MLPIFAQYSQSLPKMGRLPLPELPPTDLLFLSLSTAAWLAALSTAAWLAALTAAFSLWRFGASGAHRPKSNDVTSSRPPPCPTPPTAPLGPTETAPPTATTTAACHVKGVLGSPRSRFTVSYICDDEDYCHVEEGDDQEGGDGGDWEVMGPRWMGVRGDLGWYRYQDRAAIDGSVVRLWGGRDGGLTARERVLSLMATVVKVERGI